MDVQTFCVLGAVFIIGVFVGVSIVQRKGDNMENEHIEELADLVHEIWADWMKYMFSKGHRRNINQSRLWGEVWIMPEDLRQRWTRQMNTDYEELSEKEKESDREIALKILELVKGDQHD